MTPHLEQAREALKTADENLRRYRKAYGSDLYTIATDSAIRRGFEALDALTPPPTEDRARALETFDKGRDNAGKSKIAWQEYSFRPEEVELIRSALSSHPASGGEWMPIESAPDGKKILVICKIALSDAFFEPEIAYRNCEYWFHEPGIRMFSPPHFWMPLPSPPTKTDEGGE
jgi:hypothetical protein